MPDKSTFIGTKPDLDEAMKLIEDAVPSAFRVTASIAQIDYNALGKIHKMLDVISHGINATAATLLLSDPVLRDGTFPVLVSVLFTILYSLIKESYIGGKEPDSNSESTADKPEITD